VRIDVGKQREVGVVFLPGGRDGLCGAESRLVFPLAEKRFGQIEFHIVGIRIQTFGGLEVADRVVIKAITRKQRAGAGLRTEILPAHFVKLRDRCAGFRNFPQFQIRFREQIQILRTSWMHLDLFGEFTDIELRSLFCSERSAIVEIVEEVLVRIRSRRRIFGERLKYAQVALRCVELLQVSFNHCELVVAGGGSAAGFYIFPEKFGGFGETPRVDAEIRNLQQRVRIVGIDL